jgi:hypothetical protein
LALSDPLLDTLGVEDVLLVAVQTCYKVLAVEVTPADGALLPKATLAALAVLVLLFVGRLLVLELGLVQRRKDFWYGQRHRQKTSEHAIDEQVAFFLFGVEQLFLELIEWNGISPLLAIPLGFLVSPPHDGNPSLNDGPDQTGTLENNDDWDQIVKDDAVAEHRNQLEGRVQGLAQVVSVQALVDLQLGVQSLWVGHLVIGLGVRRLKQSLWVYEEAKEEHRHEDEVASQVHNNAFFVVSLDNEVPRCLNKQLDSDQAGEHDVPRVESDLAASARN